MFDQWDKLSSEDFEKISQIVKRAVRESNAEINVQSLNMDIGACHVMEHINLDKLLIFPLGDFLHDVFGIERHVDRNTGKLLNCFWPRCGGAES